MAQSGYTPILIYASGTATNVPLAANMTSSASGAELALNYADGKLYYKDSGGVVQVLASKAGNVNVASFSAGTTGFTPNTATTGAVTLAGTLITSNGGTGLSSYTAGDLSYYASGTALTKLAIGTAGQILTSSGTAPQWSTLSGVAVTTFSAGTTGFTPSSATAGAVTLAGTLATTNGGTGLTSFTSGGVVYASSTSALATGSALTFDGTNLSVVGTGYFQSTSNAATNATSLRLNGTTSGYNRMQIANSAGGYYIGTNSSAGADWVTGTTAYALVISTPTRNIQFSASTAADVTINTSGNVGIGTSSPNGKLSLKGAFGTTATSGLTIEATGSTTGLLAPIAFYLQSSGWGTVHQATITAQQVSGTDGGANLIFSTSTTGQFAPSEDMRITSAGRVCIGTTEANRILNAYESESTAVSSSTFYNASYAGLYLRNTSNTTNTVCGIGFSGGSSGNSCSGIGNILESVNLGALGFFTGGAGVSSTAPERMRITSAGNVGIGTSSPSSILQVVKSTAQTDIDSSTQVLLLENTATDTSGNLTGIRYRQTNGTNAGQAFIGLSSTGNSSTRGSLVFASPNTSGNSTERMRIISDGSVLVATSSRGATADLSSTQRLVVGNSGDTSGAGGYSSGFGEFYYTGTFGGTASFLIRNGVGYLASIWSSSGSSSSNPVLYLIFGLNKGGGSNPTMQVIGGGTPNWTFSYALNGAYDCIVTITDGGTNQGTRVVLMQLGSQ